MRGRLNKEEKYHSYISQLEAKEKRKSMRHILFLCTIATVGLGALLLFQMGMQNADTLAFEDFQMRPEPRADVSGTETSFEHTNIDGVNYEKDEQLGTSKQNEATFITGKNSSLNENESRDKLLSENQKKRAIYESVSTKTPNASVQHTESRLGSRVEEAISMPQKPKETSLNEEKANNLVKDTKPKVTEDPKSISQDLAEGKVYTPITQETQQKDNNLKNPVTESSSIPEVNTKREEKKVQKPLQLADKMPQFPGGQSAMNKFISKRINYPLAAKDHNIQGKVYLQFVVQPNGALTNMKVVRKLGYGCDEEALRVAKKMPKWIPGEDEGKKVSVIYTLAVQFSIR